MLKGTETPILKEISSEIKPIVSTVTTLEQDLKIIVQDAVLTAQIEVVLAAKHTTVLAQKEDKIASQKEHIAKLERMLFGQKRERFEAPIAHQLPLPFDMDAEVIAVLEKEVAKKIEAKQAKAKTQSKHRGRTPLPEHLEVRETIIEPDVDTTEMVCVGQEITDELGYQPEVFFIKRTIRKKYAPKSGEGKFAIALLPDRLIERGIASTELVTQIIVDKYIYHIPLYRFQKRLLLEGIKKSDVSLGDWVAKALDVLDILYGFLIEKIRAKGYLQVDETTLKVLESENKGKSHLGYYWVYNSPVDNTLFFEYHPNRKGENVNETLKDFKGYLQTDGYSGYHQIGKKDTVTHLCCLAHARRKFEESLENDNIKSSKAMVYIQSLYAIEAQAREEKLSPEQRKELRLTKSLPIYNAFGKWMYEELPNILPKSKIGQAFQYTLARWEELGNYMLDGNLEIDNNLVENAIRPVALGRKNYLFAGTHESAQRAAIMYTFFGICQKQNVNPSKWLNYVLNRIQSTSIQKLEELLPQNYKG